MPRAQVHREPFVLLADAAPGHTGRVLRVSDRDPELLRAVEAAGVAVGADGDGDGCRDPAASAATTCRSRPPPREAVWLSA